MTRILLVALCFSLLSGCTILENSADSPSLIDEVSHQLLPGFELGLTDAEVADVLGVPNSILNGDFAGFIYFYGENSRTSAPSETEILFSENFENRAVALTVRAPYPVTTRMGVGIGATAAEIRDALGTPDESELGVSSGTSGQEYFSDLYFGTGSLAARFSYDSGGRVRQIDVFLQGMS